MLISFLFQWGMPRTKFKKTFSPVIYSFLFLEPRLLLVDGSIENEDPENEDPKTYENEDLQKRRPPTKTTGKTKTYDDLRKRRPPTKTKTS